jgi:hypothetical protein
MKKKHSGTCIICGSYFTGNRGNGKRLTCGGECAKQHKRNLKKSQNEVYKINGMFRYWVDKKRADSAGISLECYRKGIDERRINAAKTKAEKHRLNVIERHKRQKKRSLFLKSAKIFNELNCNTRLFVERGICFDIIPKKKKYKHLKAKHNGLCKKCGAEYIGNKNKNKFPRYCSIKCATASNALKSKTCARCKITREIDCFQKYGPFCRGDYKYSRVCNTCHNIVFVVRKLATNKRHSLVIVSGFAECSKCKITKPIDCFSVKTGRVRTFRCKECISKYNQERVRSWSDEQRSEHNKKLREYLDKNPKIKALRGLMSRHRKMIARHMKGESVTQESNRLIGCTVQDLRDHMESQFKDGMTWNNYGQRGWHVDHIIPLSKFDLSDENQRAIAMHYTNLQPLWWRDNIKKGNKMQKQDGLSSSNMFIGSPYCSDSPLNLSILRKNIQKPNFNNALD